VVLGYKFATDIASNIENRIINAAIEAVSQKQQPLQTEFGMLMSRSLKKQDEIIASQMRMIKIHYQDGIDALRYANSASDKEQKKTHINRAIDRFTSAGNVEVGEASIEAVLLVGACFYALRLIDDKTSIALENGEYERAFQLANAYRRSDGKPPLDLIEKLLQVPYLREKYGTFEDYRKKREPKLIYAPKSIGTQSQLSLQRKGIQKEVTKLRVITPAVQRGDTVSSLLSPLVIEKLALLRTLTGHTDGVLSVAISADGETLVSGSIDQTIKVWNLSTGQTVRTLTGHTDGVLSVAISADGETLVSGGLDATIEVWNLSIGQAVRTLTGHTRTVHSVAISADGQTLASGGLDATIEVWNLSTGQAVRTLTGHTSYVNSVAFSANGQTLASGGYDTKIKVWNLSTGQAVRTLIGHTASVLSVALSADGQTLASGGSDGTIKVWNLSTSQAVRTLTGHTGAVISVALSADGQTLVSGSHDTTIKVWNLSTSQAVRTLTGHTDDVNSVALSADGQTLVSGSFDMTIKVWKA